MSIIAIDGVKYDVRTASLNRDAEIIYDPLTAGVMLDFSEVDDAAATKYRYSLTIEPKSAAEYDAFYYDITSPKSVRSIDLPFGQGRILFKAKIKSASDALRKSFGGANKWGGLSVTFEPVKPQRYE